MEIEIEAFRLVWLKDKGSDKYVVFMLLLLLSLLLLFSSLSFAANSSELGPTTICLYFSWETCLRRGESCLHRHYFTYLIGRFNNAIWGATKHENKGKNLSKKQLFPLYLYFCPNQLDLELYLSLVSWNTNLLDKTPWKRPLEVK